MFRQKIEKETKLVAEMKAIWENGHGEEVSDAYNKIVKIMRTLDTYSANMVMNLVWLQTVQKTFEATIGKEVIK